MTQQRAAKVAMVRIAIFIFLSQKIELSSRGIDTSAVHDTPLLAAAKF